MPLQECRQDGMVVWARLIAAEVVKGGITLDIF